MGVRHAAERKQFNLEKRITAPEKIWKEVKFSYGESPPHDPSARFCQVGINF